MGITNITFVFSQTGASSAVVYPALVVAAMAVVKLCHF